MNEQEYKNAVQLLLSRVSTNYLIGFTLLIKHYSLEYLCNLIVEDRFRSNPYYIYFGDFCIFHCSGEVSTKNNITGDYYQTFIPSLETETPYKDLMLKEIHKHLIRIFDSLV